MPHTEFSLKTSDGTTLHGKRWLPTGKVRASINLIHGLGEHCGRYNHVAHAFNQAGYAVSAVDLRGHGRTKGVRGHIPSFEIAASDINLLIQHTRKELPGSPQFLYGHSLGGILVLYTSLFHSPQVNGVIATSPGLSPGKVPPAKLAAAKVLRKLMPSFTMNNGLDLANLSHDQEVIRAYKADPLVHPKISASLGYDMITTGKLITAYTGAFPYPLLLLQGAKDHLVDPQAVRDLAFRIDERSAIEFDPEGFHELHNEPWKEKIFTRMISWVATSLN